MSYLVSAFDSFVDRSGFIGVLVCLVVFLGVPMLIEVALGMGLVYCLDLIKNKVAKKAVTVIVFIVFLPCMAAAYGTIITETEPFSAWFAYNLRTRSRLLILVNFVYFIAIYYVYKRVFA